MSNVHISKRTAIKASLTRFATYFVTVKVQENIDLLELQRRLI